MIAALSLLVAAGLNAYLCWRILRKPRRPEGRTLGLITLALSWWSLFYGLHIVAPGNLPYTFNIIKYLGGVFVPPLWFVLCAQYVQKWERYTVGVRRLLFLPPVLALAVILTDPLLHGWWPSTEMVKSTYLGSTFMVLHSKHSLLYYLHAFGSYTYIVSGLVLLQKFLRGASPIYRRQVNEMSFAIIIPLVANIVTQIHNFAPWGLDTFFFTITAILFGQAIFRHRLLELVPVARQTVLEQIPEGIITLDEQNTILDVNQSICDVLQMSPKDLVGRPLEARMAASTPFFNAIQDVLSRPAQAQWSQEVHLVSPPRAYLLHSTPLRYNGYVVGRILVLQDISEQINARKQIEMLYKQAEQERQRLATTLENVNDGILLLDNNGTVVAGNDTAKNLLPHEHIHQFPGAIRQTWEKVQESEKPLRIEFALGQQTFHISLSIVPQFGFVINLHDITPLVESLRLNNELLAILSHDLRAPLSSISGYAQLAQMDNLSRQEYIQIFQRIDSSARRLANFASDVLTLSRLETGVETSTTNTPVIINKIAQYIAQDMEGAATAKGLLLHLDVQPHPPLYGDPHLIEQMWRNLIDNAIKYTHAGFIRIAVKYDGVGSVVAQITDTGCGIVPEDLPHIYEKFYRSQTHPQQGIGLGLSLVKNVVEKHHGSIQVESIPDQGTTFIIRFPLG
ncbi:MAG: hypothetical protein Fur0018_16870 [Anaerolineales bacterium]